MDINDLRRDRKAAADNMAAAADALVQLENEKPDDADSIAAATATFDTAKAAFDKLDAQVGRAEATEAAQASAALRESEATPAAHVSVPGQVANADHKGAEAGFMIGALLNCKGDKDKAAAKLEADGHSGLSASLTSATEGAGGVTLPRPTSAALIELLQPRVVVRRAGAVVHDMPAGTLRNARMTVGATATYGAELAATAPSQQTFDKVDETFKKLTSLVPASNSLLRFSSLSMAMLIRDNMLDQMAIREDLAFLRGDGTSDTPNGIRSFCPAGNLVIDVATTAAAAEAVLRSMVSKLEDANVRMVRPVWIMRSSTKNWLAGLREAVGGNKVYPSIDGNGTLKGYPIETTSQLLDNLGAGGNQSEVYLVDMAEMMIGDAMEIRVDTSTEAAYVDSGTTHSAFQKDQTLFRAISEHDFASRHDEAIAVTQGILWE